jgi:hypothetical protein
LNEGDKEPVGWCYVTPSEIHFWFDYRRARRNTAIAAALAVLSGLVLFLWFIFFPRHSPIDAPLYAVYYGLVTMPLGVFFVSFLYACLWPTAMILWARKPVMTLSSEGIKSNSAPCPIFLAWEEIAVIEEIAPDWRFDPGLGQRRLRFFVREAAIFRQRLGWLRWPVAGLPTAYGLPYICLGAAAHENSDEILDAVEGYFDLLRTDDALRKLPTLIRQPDDNGPD